jgi:hypothetical protein
LPPLRPTERQTLIHPILAYGGAGLLADRLLFVSRINANFTHTHGILLYKGDKALFSSDAQVADKKTV